MQVYAATLTELVRDFAQRDGAKPALIFADQSISYADLDPDRASREWIGVVRNLPGDRVALLVPNIPEFVIVYYAVLRCGGIVCQSMCSVTRKRSHI